MLTSLSIKNVVLIDSLTINFAEGFCALTGETGAGKSILLDALGLALGARSDAGLVRKGTDQAVVTAGFDVGADHPVYALLRDSALVIENGEALILRRLIASDGRSKAFINDQPVSIALLRQAGDMLVEIHGQFDTHGLLDPKTHRALLDEFAGIDGAPLSRLWEGWKTAQANLAEEREKIERARADEEYLRQAVEDLDALDPKQGEEESLSSLRERLMRREQILESLSAAYEALSEAGGITGSAGRALERAGDTAADLLAGLDRADAEMQEVLSGIQRLSSDLEHSEYALEEIDERLYALRGQARKHGCNVDDLASVREDLAVRLNSIAAQDDILAGLVRDAEKARQDFIAAAEKVSAARRKAAIKLDRQVAAELSPLKLDKARFVTDVEELEESEWGPGGFDRVRFLVATTPGAQAGPLGKIASGGELARFTLALKVVLAETGNAASLVFDEVDSGIGGATAAAVGERLARLALKNQILVVTHSPQVAARAAHHWIVLKDGKEDVRTTVIPLDETHERREEIARMLSGASVSTEARAAADKLLESGT